MRMPNVEDIRDLANYVLMGDREKDDFMEQVQLGDLAPEGDKDLNELLDELGFLCSPADSSHEALDSLDGDDVQVLALAFGSSHAYPTALRIMAALNEPAKVVEAELDDETKEKAKEAYERTVGKD